MNEKIANIVLKSKSYNNLANPESKNGNTFLILSSDEIYLEHFLLLYANSFFTNKNSFSSALSLKNNLNVKLYGFDDEKFDKDSVNEIINATYLSSILEDKPKIFLIRDFSMLDVRYQNKLLKTLEDSDTNNVFILGSTNSFGVIDTIKSRCRKIGLEKLEKVALRELFSDFDSEKFDFFYDSANGNLTSMQMISSDNEYLDVYDIIKETFLSLRKSTQVIDFIDMLFKDVSSRDFEEMQIRLEKAILIYEFYIRYLIDSYSSRTRTQDVESILSFYNLQALANMEELLGNVVNRLKLNMNPRDSYRDFLYKVLEARYKCQEL